VEVLKVYSHTPTRLHDLRKTWKSMHPQHQQLDQSASQQIHQRDDHDDILPDPSGRVVVTSTAGQ